MRELQLMKGEMVFVWERKKSVYQEHRARSSSWPGAPWLGVIIHWNIHIVSSRVLYLCNIHDINVVYGK